MFNSFSANLAQIRKDSEARYALLVEHAEEIGGHPAYVPPGVNIHPAYWLDELESRYWNMADFYEWPELPGYDHNVWVQFKAQNDIFAR